MMLMMLLGFLLCETLAIDTNSWIASHGTSTTIGLNQWVSSWGTVIDPSLRVTVVLNQFIRLLQMLLLVEPLALDTNSWV